jgi:hypothetical protein
MAELCREFGISRKTGYKIFDRYQECGMQGLTDRSRRPYRYANRLPFQVELQGMQSSADGIVDRLFPDRLVTLQPLFQVLVDRLGHLKHVQFLTAKDRLQFIVGQDFSFVLWILKFVLLNVRPNLFRDFSSRQWFCANNFGQVL